jgi:uncharacterized Zn-finger protein
MLTMPVPSVSGSPSVAESHAEARERQPSSFMCEICLKEFSSEAQLTFHKDIEHVKHLPLSGVA